jgi:ATP/ADP translocase
LIFLQAQPRTQDLSSSPGEGIQLKNKEQANKQLSITEIMKIILNSQFFALIAISFVFHKVLGLLDAKTV